MKLSKSHPRYKSLRIRDLIVDGVDKGITSIHGLIAHGRGEAFDYLLNEKTHYFARESIKAAVAMLILAVNPVISVNGNAAMLVPKEIIKLSIIVNAKIEVNIFHPSKIRERKIKNHLIKNGATEVLLSEDELIKNIDHNRKFVNKNGIKIADVVFVPLEDGDRCGALKKNGKKVICVDLNPLSRTSKFSDISIIDNLVRTMDEMIACARVYANKKEGELRLIIKKYNNTKNLGKAENLIKRLDKAF